MKFLTSFLLVFFSFNSFAQDFNDTRKATDLILFPNANELIAGINYYSSSVEFDWEYTFRNYSTNKITENGFEVAAMYAFNDNWAAAVDLQYATSQKSEVTYGPATTIDGTKVEAESDGLSDPNFAITYRALDAALNSFDMNISLIVSPKLQDAKAATANKDGNVAKGGTNIGADIKWGQRFRIFSWAVGASFLKNGKAEYKDADDGDLTTVSSYSTFDISGEFKWNITSKFSLGVNLSLASTGEYQVNDGKGGYINYESAPIISIGGTANIALQENLYLTFDATAAAVDERFVTDENNTLIRDTDRRATLLKVGIIAQF